MILIMGIMIPLGDYSPELWLGAVATFAIYWMIVLGLAFWTILLAVGDLLATRTHAAVEMNSLNRQRAELENAARALQERQRRDAEN